MTVGSGVTIGSMTAPVNAQGIYLFAEQPANTGASLIASAAAIHSRGFGILMDRRGSGDVTVTNSGSIVTAAAGGQPTQKSGIRVMDSTANRGDGRTASTRTTVTNSGSIAVSAATAHGIHVDAEGLGLYKTVNSGTVSASGASGHGIFINAEEHQGAADTDAVVVESSGDITASGDGIHVKTDLDDADSNRGKGSGAIKVDTDGGKITANGIGINIAHSTPTAGDITITSSASIEAESYGISVSNGGSGGGVTVNIAAGATLNSRYNAGVYANLEHADNSAGKIEITQGGTIAARKGVYARAGRFSAANETRMAQPLINVAWSGTFADGNTARTAPNDNDRFVAATAARAIALHQEVETEKTIRYGSAAGIEAHAMSWREVMAEAAKGDDPDEIANRAAQLLLVPTGATAADNAYVREFRAALGNRDIDASAVLTAIDSTATSLDDVTDAEIVTYLQADDGDRRTLLRNILAQGFTDAEKAVLRAVARDTGLDTALGDEDAAFPDVYKTAVRELLDRYNVGNIRIAMDGGSIASRGDGIRAYYATAHDNNGAISVTVAEGAEVTGGMAGIYVANAGAMGTGDARILKQTVTVNGMVTGGSDAAVHLVGGGRLTVGRTGEVLAGSSGRAIRVNDPGRAVIRIDGVVKGGRGRGAEAVPAVHLTGGGSVTVGPKGMVVLNEGAALAIRADGAPTQVTVLQDPDLATSDGGLTRDGVNDAVERLGTVGGDSVVENDLGEPLPNAIAVRVRETTPEGDPTGYERRGTIGDDNRVTVNTEGLEGPLDPKSPPVPSGPDDATVFGSCDGVPRCRLYAALPSALLAMNGLPTYGERMAAARDGNGGWARIDGATGEWKAKSATQPNMAFDYRRYGVQAGVDFAAGSDGRFGVSVRGLQGSAEMAGSGGEIELSGVGAGAHGTAFLGDGFHVDAQAMATWYDVKLTSGKVLKDGAKALGLALGVEVGRRMDMGGGLTVTPAAGLAWSDASLDFTDPPIGSGGARVSLEDARSLAGRAGLRAEAQLEGGLRLSGSLEATHEFAEERTAKISEVALKTTEAERTGVRVGVGGARSWEDGRYALRAAAGYAARGSGEIDGGISFAMRF